MSQRLSIPGKPGFQGSETSGAEVVFYGQKGDPITLHGETLQTTGKRRRDREPSLISVTTNKQMGSPSGQWSVTLKQPKGISESLFDMILDDDWIDITFYRHGRRWHVMRGLVDEVRRAKIVSGTGATSEAFSITGKCFGKIWEKTPVFFSIYTDSVVAGGISYRVFTGATNVLGTPAQAVDGYLFGFLQALGDQGRANWTAPAGMPNFSGGFGDNAIHDHEYSGFTNTPPRYALNPNFLNPQGKIWSLAQEWSDPMFLEMFTDTLPLKWKSLTSEDTYDNHQTHMHVILRDRPFPTLALGKNSPWFSLPMIEVPLQVAKNHDVGRGGQERYNAFFVSQQLTQTLLGMGSVDLVKPLWNEDDMLRHGMCRFDIMSRYLPDNMDLATMSWEQREQVRDWYCLNAYMYSGTLGFGIGLPNLRIGTRLRLKGDTENKDETYYVESVANSWSLQPGLKTSAGVTRGWVGTDNSYMEALEKMASKYKVPPEAVPGDFAFA